MNDARTRAELDFVAAWAKYVAASVRLSELSDQAEEGSSSYEEADDFRNYGYADATETALTCAEQLLTQLGYTSHLSTP